MNKLCKSIVSFLIIFLSLQAAYCQDTTSFCQDIAEKFRKYCEALPREEVFIHTDRSEYIAGELLWFNIYLVDRQSNKPSQKNRIVYVELLNSQNWPVVQKRLGIEEGSGPGQIALPDTLSSGKYTIRAYTSWMKNFLPYNCFTQDLNIYNAFKQQPVRLTSNKAGSVNNISENSNYSGNSNQGLNLRVNNLEQDSLLIFINEDDKFRSDNHNYCYLLVQTHGIINLVKTIRLSSSGNRLALNKKILIPGINQITIFNAGGQPVSERFIYTPAEENKLLILNCPDSIHRRDKIAIEIRPLKSGDTTFSIKNLSMSSAVKTEWERFQDISDYMIFGTEFGFLPDEIRYHNLKSLSPDLIDSFLLTVKSSWIDWNAVITGNFPHLRYQAEKDDHFIKGTLLKKKLR